MSGPLYPQIDPNRYRGGISGRGLAGALVKRMFDRPLYTKSSGGGWNWKGDVGMGARGAYADTAKPLVDFARRPGVGTGVGAAITLGPGSSFRGKLAQKLGTTIGARMALDKADASMILLKNDRPGEDFLKLFRPFEGEVKPGKRYILPVKNPYGASVNGRVAIIQDPETGTMFAAPHALHGDLMDYATTNIKGVKPKDYSRWFQHELYDADPSLSVPARLMHGLNPDKDTELATYARAKLIGKLGRVGIKTGKHTKAPSYKERLAAPGANKAMADMLSEVLKRGARHKQPS